MDMYKKRKMRQERKNNSNNNRVDKNSINWYKPNYGKLPMKAYK